MEVVGQNCRNGKLSQSNGYLSLIPKKITSWDTTFFSSRVRVMMSINTFSIEEVRSCFSKINEKELECKLEERAQYYLELLQLFSRKVQPHTIQGWIVAPKDRILSKYIPHSLTVGYCPRENTSRTELCSPVILG